MSEHEKRLRAILPTADEPTLDAAIAAAEARGFARGREMAAQVIDLCGAECSGASKRRLARAIRAIEDGGAPDVAATSRGQGATFTLEEVRAAFREVFIGATTDDLATRLCERLADMHK